jgi:8-oxo-dGTP pyrophosphatase MutT (NUDIX family)
LKEVLFCYSEAMSENQLLQRVAAKAVIEAENGLLALHPSEIDQNRNWHIPGGIRDDITEPLAATAIREVLEETGIDLTDNKGRVFRIGEWLGVDKGKRVKILAVFFHYKLGTRPTIKLSDEHVDFAWLDKENHRDYEANLEVHEIVEELLG